MAVKCILTGQTPSVLDGVTENVQTQLNGKVDKVTGKGLSTNDYTSAEKTKLSGIETGAQKNTITGVKGSAETTYRTGNVNITATNIGLGNVNNTSDAEKPISTATKTALDGKQAKVTGAATTITDSNLTADRALISNSSGKVAVSSVTSTELGYLDGVTSNIQTQLNNKLSSAPVTSVNNKTGAVSLKASDVGLGNVDNTSDVNKPISNATQAALNGKQAKITASGLLKGDGAGGVSAAEAGTDYVASPEVFIATYGTTTYAEIKDAYDAGKICICKKDAFVAQLAQIISTVAVFTGIRSKSASTTWLVYASSNNWSDTSSTDGYTPKSHASTHASAGADPITPASIGAASIPTSVAVTLPISGWDHTSKSQTVTVSGILDEENAQLITPSPALASQSAYYESSILCTGQAENSLTFTAENIPEDNLTVYVIIQEVSSV